ncbi:hypothetical protein ES706_04255 [subsurface metagenome]
MRRFLALIAVGLVAVGILLTPATAQADFGIDPGKVFIENLYPGAEADIPITIYNQNDYETAFKVRVREPDYTEPGYETLPYLGWVTITPDQLTIAPRGQAEVLVVITMPEDTDYGGKKAEVWISFMEQETDGMIRIELCSRLLISTRAEAENGAPAVYGSGSVGITAEAGEKEPASSFSLWGILGPVLGVLLVGGGLYTMLRKKSPYGFGEHENH